MTGGWRLVLVHGTFVGIDPLRHRAPYVRLSGAQQRSGQHMRLDLLAHFVENDRLAQCEKLTLFVAAIRKGHAYAVFGDAVHT